jgi:hypothetical protein
MNHRAKKIYYVPGLISLIFLLLLFFVRLKQQGALKKFGLLEINLIEKRDLSQIPKRNYLTIDSRKTAEIRDKIESIAFNKDSINGIHVKFDISTKYAEVVATYNEIEKVSNPNLASLIHNYDLWIFHRKRNKSEAPHYFYCGTGDMMQRQYEEREKIRARGKFLSDNEYKFIIITAIYLAIVFYSLVYIKSLLSEESVSY